MSVSRRPLVVVLALVLLMIAACGDRGGPGEGDGDRSARRGPMGEMMEGMGPGMMQRDASMGMMLPEGIAAEELPAPDSRGARLAARFCSGCHGIPSPGRYGEGAWPDVLDRMFRWMDHMSRMSGMRNRMMGRRDEGRMMNVEAPSPDERRDLRAYYREHALAEAEAETITDYLQRAARSGSGSGTVPH